MLYLRLPPAIVHYFMVRILQHTMWFRKLDTLYQTSRIFRC